MEKLRDFIGIALIVMLVGLALVLNYGCATSSSAATPAKPLPPVTCMALVNSLNGANLKEGFKLLDKQQGQAGELILVYGRESDSVRRVEVFVPKDYPAPPAKLNLKDGADCTIPTGQLFKTYRGEAVVIEGDKA